MNSASCRPWLVSAAALALMASGAAALVNQVVWQDSLRRFLGGSEALSSMVVVLVFMAGLGLGALAASRFAGRVACPLRALGWMEVALAIVNLGVRSVLDSHLPEVALHVQGVALSLGVSLLFVCAAGGTVLLLVPCLAMGATMPLAAEACQRELRIRDPQVLGLLFGLNTLGSVCGAAVGSALLIPSLGHSLSLLVAAGLNLLAGLLLLAQRSRTAATPMAGMRESSAAGVGRWLVRPTLNELLALGLGFCSLGYEMYLLRLLPLRHRPTPYTFAAVVAGFLLFWSLGAAITARRRWSVGVTLPLTAVAVAMSVYLLQLDTFRPITSLESMARFVLMRGHYFLPCFLFGGLFATVTERAARSWGADVGRISAYNTLGSCAGVVTVTLLGYEHHVETLALAIAWVLAILASVEWLPRRRVARLAWLLVASSLLGAVVSRAATQPPLWVGSEAPVRETYFGRNGVIGVDQGGSLFWNGLWHSRLAKGGNHVGSNNWLLAVAPVLSHSGPVRSGLVIGLGTGVTAGTLARLGTMQRVDVYEINPTLKRLLERHPEGTLNVRADPKVRLIWQDARIGLALDPTKYDVIVSQPLYLGQAGSGLLNSVEFYRAVSHRLKPGGVFCLYSNGSPQQAFLVRQTAQAVFRSSESYLTGYLLVLSNEPMDLTPEAMRARFRAGQGDRLWQEIESYPLTRDGETALSLLDRPRLPWGDGRLVITDDRSLVEHEQLLEEELRRLGYRDALPSPRHP